MRKFFLILFIAFAINSYSQVQLNWRNGGTGIYNETGLLKKWPENGPELLWHNDSLPNGYSSVAISHKMIYSTGNIDSMDYLYALDMKGVLKWKTPIGKAWTMSFPESRSTPTIDDKRIYACSGWGTIICADAKTGKTVWTKDAGKEFGARYNTWGVSESLVIKDDKLYFSPIGNQTTTIALNKMTGELIWKSENIGDSLAYVTPVLINYGGKNILLNVGACYIFGVDADNGKILWKSKYVDINHTTDPWPRIINCTSPLYADGKIYVTSGYNHVGVMLKLKEDVSDVQLMYIDTVLDNHHGGVLKLGNYIYGSNWTDNSNGNWCCIDWETGKVKYETKWKAKGSIIANDGMLYCFEERTGYLALVPVNPDKFEPVSSFKIPYGRGPYWSHPVIDEGVLYIRHGNSIMAYNLKAKS